MGTIDLDADDPTSRMLSETFEKLRKAESENAALRERVAEQQVRLDAEREEGAQCIRENMLLGEKLAVATQELQHIKAKTTDVMAMVWCEEALKKLGVE